MILENLFSESYSMETDYLMLALFHLFKSDY